MAESNFAIKEIPPTEGTKYVLTMDDNVNVSGKHLFSEEELNAL